MEPDMEVLEDIMFKFVYNLGQEYLSNPVQLLFQIERAWWYYEDTVRVEKPYRHYATYGAFTCMLASKVSTLKTLLGGDPLAALKEYQAYKVKIPVYGAILMDKDMERVLLVRGQASSSGWGFPKGKINAGEAEVDCACREVMEETGCNIEPLIEAGAFIEAKGQNDKVHKLFIVVGVDPETTAFAPQTAGEIGAYSWHWLGELPATRDDADQAYIASGGKQHRFYMVQPFISRLQKWVSKRRRSLGLPPPSWESGGTSAFALRTQQSTTSTPQPAARQNSVSVSGTPGSSGLGLPVPRQGSVSGTPASAGALQPANRQSSVQAPMQALVGTPPSASRQSSLQPPGQAVVGTPPAASRPPSILAAMSGMGGTPPAASRPPSLLAAMTASATPPSASRLQQQSSQGATTSQIPTSKVSSQIALPAVSAAVSGLLHKRQFSAPLGPAVIPAVAPGSSRFVPAGQLGQVQGEGGGSKAPNLVLSSAFRFDVDAIMQCLAG